MKFLGKTNLTIIFFFTLFLIGSYIFNDYGISIDEDNSRINGLVSLKYISQILNLNLNIDFDNIPNINEYDEQGNGVVFDLPLIFLEYFFDVQNFREKYLLRHFFSFAIFYISLIFFFKIIKNNYKSDYLPFIGVLFLFLSPRIFAESFYNSKDIGFMSLNIISTYYGLEFLKNKNKSNLVLFSITCALSTGIRLLGIFNFLFVLFFFLIDILRSDKIKKTYFLFFFLLIIFFISFTILFWPYLWSNPFNNFSNAFTLLSNHYRPVNNFFLGEYVSALYVPWYYIFLWISITTPIFILILFLYGFFIISKRFFKRLININEKNKLNDIWRSYLEKKNIFICVSIIVPLFTVILFHSSLYNGWRHFYFIYPSIILVTLYSIYIINIFKKFKKIIYFVIIFFFINNSFWLIKNHPFQFTYFNILAKNNFNKYFEIDYWGVSNHYVLKFLSEKNKDKIIKVGLIGDGDLYLSKMFLQDQFQNNIIITYDYTDSDYLIDNFNRWNGIKKTKIDDYVKENYSTFHEIKNDNVIISRIYKNNFKELNK